MRKTRPPSVLRGWVLANVILAALAGVLLVLDLSIFLAGTLPSISTTLAALIAGIATLALAALTGVIIVLNAGVLDATRQAAEATKAEADATHEAAVATRDQVTELRISREVEFRPLLVVPQMEPNTSMAGGFANRDLTLQNLGRGPALNAFFVREEVSGPGSRVLRSDPVDLAPGASLGVSAWEHDESIHPLLFHRHDLPRELLIYQDQFANIHRLIPGFLQPAIWTREEDEGGVGEEPGWVRGVKEILFAVRPEPEPPSGPYFIGAISISGAQSYCQATVALEAVPVTDSRPTDAMRDRADIWMTSLKPGAKPPSLDVNHWQVEREGVMSGEEWEGRLEAGPMIAVRQILDLNARPTPAGSGGQPVADLQLLALVTWWKQIIAGGMEVMRDIGVSRFRPGLALVTKGSWDHPRLADVDFSGLPSPERTVVPRYQVPDWSQAYVSFDVGDFPRSALEHGVRAILRLFGYREVDEVIRALGIEEPTG